MGTTSDTSGSGSNMSTGSITLDPGDLLAGRYRLEERLGQGSFGVVYRATQVDMGREVALKILHPDLLHSVGSVKRFVREAQLAQRLEHPNTVKLFDVGQTHDGLPYIAFQMLRGRPLDRILDDDGPMPAHRVARIASQVLKSLMEAHDQGIIHRDIKPANIFLSDFQGEPDFVTVLDFGIAKPIAKQGEVASTALTAHGMPIGTPSYMAPEQVNGDETVGPEVDIYALGLVMAELLTGEMIVRGPSLLEICLFQVSLNPISLPTAILSSPLGAVIRRATEKRRALRFRSAREMFEALESLAQTMGTGRNDLRGVVAGDLGQSAAASPHRARTLPQQSEPGTYPASLASASGSSSFAPPRSVVEPLSEPPTSRHRSFTDSQRLLMALAFGAGVLVLLLVTGLVVVIGVLMRRDEPSVNAAEIENINTADTVEGAPTIAAPAEPVILPAGDGTKLGSLTTDMIRQRIEGTGWQVHYISEFGGQGRGQGYSFMIKKGRGSGSVTLMLFESSSVQLGSRTIGPNNSVVFQGKRALEVEVAPNGDPTVSPDAARLITQAIMQ